ncbi:MAG: NAD(+)/NADH kinase [Planctomycetota bacterium]
MSEIRRVLCHSNPHKEESTAAGVSVEGALRDAGFEICRDLSEDPDVLILLGGDGFLMETLRLFDYPKVPVFGVNFGTVGFLMNRASCADRLVTILREDELTRTEHRLLHANVSIENGDVVDCLAFNEFVLERQTGQTVRLEISVDGTVFNRFAGDGLIVSTPSGSTAYNLAAGGPAVHPDVPGILLTPLYPHQARPFHSVQFSLVLPTDSVVEIVPEDLPKRNVRLVADGQPVRDVTSVKIQDSGRVVRLLRTADLHFTRLLTEKFVGGND